MTKLILIAEDFEHDVMFLQHALSQAGVSNPVHVVNDGQEVFAYLKGEHAFFDRERFPLPGVLFLDLNMPYSDGFEVLEWLKTQPQFDQMLVIVLSGAFDAREVNRAYHLGADSFLTKPCSRQDVENLIEYFPDSWIVNRRTTVARS